MEENASPEQIFINDLWYVIKKIREKSLYTKYAEDITYPIALGFFGRPFNDDEEAVIKKLDEWKIIILTQPQGIIEDGEKRFVFEVEYPKYNKLYYLCQNALAKGVSYERLHSLIKELTHPVGMDKDLDYELWELSKKVEEGGVKKKTLMGRLLPGITNLYGYSAENRSRVKRFVELVQNQMELQGYRASTTTIVLGTKPLSLPDEMLKREGFSIPEAELLVETIDKVADHSFIKVIPPHDRYGYSRTVALEFDVTPPKPRVTLNLMVSSASALQDIKEHLESFEKKLAQSKETSIQVESKKSEVPSNDELPKIKYNSQTGQGIVNGKKFKLKDHQPEYRVFKILYEKINKKVARYDVLVAAHFYEDGDDQNPARKTEETNAINDIAKKLREKTGLNTDQLVNNNGNLTLLGEKIENPPEPTQN